LIVIFKNERKLEDIPQKIGTILAERPIVKKIRGHFTKFEDIRGHLTKFEDIRGRPRISRTRGHPDHFTSASLYIYNFTSANFNILQFHTGKFQCLKFQIDKFQYLQFNIGQLPYFSISH